MPSFQLLLYRATDLRCASSSYEACADGYLLTRDMMLWFRSHYLGAAGEDGRLEDPHASPLCAQDLTGLPPAHIVTAEFDLLRDEGRAHAERLSVAGVEVSCHWHQGLIHGCANLVGGIPAARQAIDEACAAVRVAFARL